MSSKSVNSYQTSRHASKRLALLLLATFLLLVAACRSGQQVIDEPRLEGTPLAVETVDSSPLGSPESPLDQPESPLEGADASGIDVDSLNLDTPASDQSVAIGRIVSFNSGEPLNNEVVRLLDVNCPEDVTEEEKRTRCFWLLDDANSASAITDDNGIFVFDGVPARDYVLFIGDVMTRYSIIKDGDDRPVIYTAAPGSILEMGEFAVDF